MSSGAQKINNTDLAAALFTAKKMVNEGADILDLGAVATNPRISEGSSPAVQEEFGRWVFTTRFISRWF